MNSREKPKQSQRQIEGTGGILSFTNLPLLQLRPRDWFRVRSFLP